MAWSVGGLERALARTERSRPSVEATSGSRCRGALPVRLEPARYADARASVAGRDERDALRIGGSSGPGSETHRRPAGVRPPLREHTGPGSPPCPRLLSSVPERPLQHRPPPTTPSTPRKRPLPWQHDLRPAPPPAPRAHPPHPTNLAIPSHRLRPPHRALLHSLLRSAAPARARAQVMPDQFPADSTLRASFRDLESQITAWVEREKLVS